MDVPTCRSASASCWHWHAARQRQASPTASDNPQGEDSGTAACWRRCVRGRWPRRCCHTARRWRHWARRLSRLSCCALPPGRKGMQKGVLVRWMHLTCYNRTLGEMDTFMHDTHGLQGLWMRRRRSHQRQHTTAGACRRAGPWLPGNGPCDFVPRAQSRTSIAMHRCSELRESKPTRRVSSSLSSCCGCCTGGAEQAAAANLVLAAVGCSVAERLHACIDLRSSPAVDSAAEQQDGDLVCARAAALLGSLAECNGGAPQARPQWAPRLSAVPSAG